MATLKNLYDLLNIEREATLDKVRKAFRDKAIQFHPDRNKDPKAEELFKEYEQAYYVLSDSERRKKYDAMWDAEVQSREGDNLRPPQPPDEVKIKEDWMPEWTKAHDKTPEWQNEMEDIFGEEWFRMYDDYSKMTEDVLQVHRETSKDAESILQSLDKETDAILKEIYAGARDILKKI